MMYAVASRADYTGLTRFQHSVFGLWLATFTGRSQGS